jgi:predicted kinase
MHATSLPRPALIVFGGLPGSGKTTVSRALAQRLGALWLRIDAIEQAIRNAGVAQVGPAGYGVANAVAAANLLLGHSVIADCVNPVAESRAAWRRVAAGAGAALVEVELVCSDPAEHRRRVEGRASDIPGHRYPGWEEVTRFAYAPWAGDHLVLDTAGAAVETLVARAEAHARARAASGVQKSGAQ